MKKMLIISTLILFLVVACKNSEEDSAPVKEAITEEVN